MSLTPAQQRNIQGLGLARFRKDHQHLLLVTFRDAPEMAFLGALAHESYPELSHS